MQNLSHSRDPGCKGVWEMYILGFQPLQCRWRRRQRLERKLKIACKAPRPHVTGLSGGSNEMKFTKGLTQRLAFSRF